MTELSHFINFIPEAATVMCLNDEEHLRMPAGRGKSLLFLHPAPDTFPKNHLLHLGLLPGFVRNCGPQLDAHLNIILLSARESLEAAAGTGHAELHRPLPALTGPGALLLLSPSCPRSSARPSPSPCFASPWARGLCRRSRLHLPAPCSCSSCFHS